MLLSSRLIHDNPTSGHLLIVVVVVVIVVGVEVGVFSVLQQFVSHSVMTLVRCVNFESISCNHGMVQLSKVDTSPEM